MYIILVPVQDENIQSVSIWRNERERARTTYLNECKRIPANRLFIRVCSRSFGWFEAGFACSARKETTEYRFISRVARDTSHHTGPDEVIAIRVYRAITPGPGL